MSLQQKDSVPSRQQWIPRPSSTADQLLLHRNENNESGGSNRTTKKGLNLKNSSDLHLPQLLQEIQDKLTKGIVECMICYDTVRRSAPIWSCSSCYSIFHLNCTNKWANAPTSSTHTNTNWRCPGCQSLQLTSSSSFIKYFCFCGKRLDPPSDFYLTPHSCGESCGKPLMRMGNLCPHLCVLQCHPGPCPPCKAFAPPRLCPCGKVKVTTRCSDHQSLITCGQQCQKLLQCGRHRCDRICHIDSCDPCCVPIKASCYCSKKSKVILCGDVVVKDEIKAKDKVFSCGATCGNKLDCRNHICTDVCHPGSCVGCSLLPTRVKTCCCGKTRFKEERLSCLDPIPTCSQLCSKPLPCGVHRCKNTCHVGNCSPCLSLVSQKCRCGSTSRIVECCKTTMENGKFTCDKPCGLKKSCGRHRCSERCCPLSNPSNILNADWDLHLCSNSCGKNLQCGKHACDSLCHRGHCPPCLQTIFTDLACACGRTSITPPLPCGTPPPSCLLSCSIPKSCCHPASHSCHYGDCPPCSTLVARECIGGHVVLMNIPCGSKDIKCNKLCGKTRQCGLHACGKTCHSPPCDDHPVVQGIQTSCGQTCGAPRRDCQHTCTAPCHPSSPCPDGKCEFPVTITCTCGRIMANVPCDAGGSGAHYNSDVIHDTSIIQKLLVSLQPLDANGKEVSLGHRKLMCNDECVKLERKRVLANAFDITSPNLDSFHFGENFVSTSELLVYLLRRDSKWILSIEERCKFLVLGKNKRNAHGLKAHVFCPMLKDKRDLVRMIAERWKLDINAVGREPKQFIIVCVAKKSKAPARVLGVKGTTNVHPPLPLAFDPLVDMDPRFVVSFSNLPRDANISALVLRFGGECELVWLNDKNAFAIFNDPTRAATTMRRLNHGSVYQGAIVAAPNVGAFRASSVTNGWTRAETMKGGELPILKSKLWKNVVIQEPGWREESWGDEEWAIGSTNNKSSIWKKEAPIYTSSNPWSVLDLEQSSTSFVVATVKVETSRKKIEFEPHDGGSNLETQHGKTLDTSEVSEVVDDWEKAYE